MSPAEAAIREALESATRCLIESTEHRVGNPRWELAANRLSKVSAELDAMRARCAAAETLLAEARDTIDTLPGYPKGADCCDRIDAHLKGAGQ